ncbi:hypothetical protein GCM10022285_63380 [Streptomyces tunisiensis]|uniref:Uncharacterized protein n=1 Tax=Streptomyces tunisiensis TaxID=948699 RepID=A0ABP7ZAL3_9ACTN
MTYSHPNKRFGHIPTRRSTPAAYCATLAARTRTERGARPVGPTNTRRDGASGNRLEGGPAAADAHDDSHPAQRTGDAARLRAVTTELTRPGAVRTLRDQENATIGDTDGGADARRVTRGR